MKFLGSLAGIALFSLAWVQPAWADPNLDNGAKIAKESCSRCHNVEANGPFKLHPPSFASIAAYRTQDQIYGRIVFPPMHASMPRVGYILSPENVEDLVAYIASLEAK